VTTPAISCSRLLSALLALVSPISTVQNSAIQLSASRDAGLQARGFFSSDHLQYRIGMFQGERDSSARNSLRALPE